MATVRDEIRKLKDVMVISFPILVPMIKRVNINKTKNGLERSFEGADDQNFIVLSISLPLTAHLPIPNEITSLSTGTFKKYACDLAVQPKNWTFCYMLKSFI